MCGGLKLFLSVSTIATVMFADIINFKDLVEDLRSMRDSIFLLNEVFTKLVEVMEMYTDIEKIKVRSHKLRWRAGDPHLLFFNQLNILQTINTKVLFVGGLSNFEEHLKDMIDFAVYLQREFTTPMSFVLDGFQTEMSVSMSFGIEQGKARGGGLENEKQHEDFKKSTLQAKLVQVLSETRSLSMR